MSDSSSVSPLSSVSQQSTGSSVSPCDFGAMAAVLREVRLAGAGSAEVCAVAAKLTATYHAYARAAGSGVQPVSSVSSGRARSPSPGAVPPGKCYLKAFRPEVALDAGRALGREPSVGALMSMPRAMFRTDAELGALRVQKGGGLAPAHLVRGFGGRSLLDVMVAAARVNPATFSAARPRAGSLWESVRTAGPATADALECSRMLLGSREFVHAVHASPVRVVLPGVAKDPAAFGVAYAQFMAAIDDFPEVFDSVHTGDDGVALVSASARIPTATDRRGVHDVALRVGWSGVLGPDGAVTYWAAPAEQVREAVALRGFANGLGFAPFSVRLPGLGAPGWREAFRALPVVYDKLFIHSPGVMVVSAGVPVGDVDRELAIQFLAASGLEVDPCVAGPVTFV